MRYHLPEESHWKESPKNTCSTLSPPMMILSVALPDQPIPSSDEDDIKGSNVILSEEVVVSMEFR